MPTSGVGQERNHVISSSGGRPLVARVFQSNPGNAKSRGMKINLHLFLERLYNIHHTTQAMDELVV